MSSRSLRTVGAYNPSQSMIGGILVGYALMLLFLAAIVTINFYPWIKDMGRKVPPAPEVYFQAAIHVFVAMIITGAIVTIGWANIDYEHTALMDWYGYNNVCLVFDEPPSKYVMPTFWFLTGYFVVRYAVSDSQRIWQIRHISYEVKVFSQIADILLILVSGFFSVCLSVGPSDDMVAHTVTFICLILIFPLVFIAHWMQAEDQSMIYTLAVVFYAALCCVKAALDIYALTRTHLDARYAQFIDF